MIRRIALFSPSLVGGGAERVMLHLARGFVERGIQVDLVLAQAIGAYLSEVPPQTRLVDLGASRVLTSLPRLVGYLRRERPGAMLSAQNHANVIALWANRIADVETRLVVCEVNMAGNEAGLKNRLMLYLMRQSYPFATGIVAVSQGVAVDLARIVRLPREKINVIYNPIVEAELQEKAKEPVEHAWFVRGEPPIILGVGRLVWHKDFFTLIRAFAQVRRNSPARLMILGEGEQRPELERLIRELGLTRDVSLPGFRNNPYAYMAKAAVYTLSSVSEGLPTALIEALALGTPVIATDCESGPREILAGGKYGQLTPVGDVNALTIAICNVIQHGKYSNPQKDWLNTFSLDTCISRYLRMMQCEVDE